jgi:hypothetical protein
MRKVITSLIFILVTSMFMFGVLGSPKSTITSIPNSAGTIAFSPQEIPQDPPGTIDGAKNPELIPDAAAYTLVLNFFADRDESERGKLLAYCRQAMLTDVNLDGMLTAARFYQQQVADLDAQAQAIREREPLATAAPKLASLQARRDAAVAEVIEKLPQFIGPRGAAALRRHMERVKAHMKIVPGPMMPSGMAAMNH